MLLRNRKGTVVILLSMIFTALIILIFAVINASIDKGVYSGVDALGKVWAISMESEYDLDLYNEYGIMAFYGDETLVNKRISDYANKTFGKKSYINYMGCKSQLDEYKLHHLNNFQKAIEWNVDTFFKNKSTLNKDKRRILNQRIIQSLPSQIGTQTNLKKSDKASELIYAFNYFNSENQVLNKSSFFANEIEYLICGYFSDEKNLKAISKKYVASRIIPNSQFIYTHPKMMEAALAAANILTPGPESAATQILLIETWALLESENDWKIIEDGGKVPLVKTEKTWALDESVLLQEGKADYVKVNSPSGLDYDGYLKVLLLEVKEETLLYRMMDLIQINMRYNHFKDFLVSDYNVGLAFKLKVNNEEHAFSQSYQER